MKLVCKHPGCGTVIQTGPEDTALANQLMEKHVSVQHDTIENKFADILEKCRTVAQAMMNGHTLSRKDARKMFDEISALTGKPLALPEKEKENVETEIKTGDDTAQAISPDTQA